MATIYPQPAQPTIRRSRMVLHDPTPTNDHPTTFEPPQPIPAPAPPHKPKCLPPYSGVDASLLTHYAEYDEPEFASLSSPLRQKAFEFQTDLLDQTTRKTDRDDLDVVRLREIANNLTSIHPDPETGAADLQAYRRTIAGRGGLGVYLILGARRHPGFAGLAEELLGIAVGRGRLGRREARRAWRAVRGRGILGPRGAETVGRQSGGVGEGGSVGVWMAGVGLGEGLLMGNEGMSGRFHGQSVVQGADAGGGVNVMGFGAGNGFPAVNGGMLNLPNGQPVGQGMNEGRGIVRHGYPTPEEDMHGQLSGQPVGPGMNMPMGSHTNGAPMYNGGMFDQSNGQPVAQGMGMPFGYGVSGYSMPNANMPGQMDGQPAAPDMATFPGIQYPVANGGMVMQPGQQPVVSGMPVASESHIQYPTANGGMVVQPDQQPVVSGMPVGSESHDPMANGGMVMLPEQQPVGLETPFFAGNQYSTGYGNMAMQPDQQPFDQGMVANAGNGNMATQPDQQPFDQGMAASTGDRALEPNGTSNTGMPDPVDGQPVGPAADFVLLDNTQVEEQLPSEMMAGRPDVATGSDDVMFGLTNYAAYERSQEAISVAMEPDVEETGEDKAESDNLDGMDLEQLINQPAVLNRWGSRLGGVI
ncbi:hypothetical protein KC338_g5990 [Hortaea werneckii]|nr:hypothetical protein KC338_g5990 [Hortaea werneckii]KAI7349611.1 hypothetical protein KC320_g5970 [Hortaea werneckii]KAI7708306.1 hypothetical protein KC322_g5134 [Hortaea werneckii]